MFKHLLVPLDGSGLSEKALLVARQALEPGGTLTLLNVVDIPDFGIDVDMLYGIPPVPILGGYDTMVASSQKNAQAYLRLLAETQPSTFKINIEVCVGSTASTIAERANALHVDAIVMTTHGRSGLNRWIFGSVTQRVLGLMPCPVVVVPGQVPAASKVAHTDEVPSTS